MPSDAVDQIDAYLRTAQTTGSDEKEETWGGRDQANCIINILYSIRKQGLARFTALVFGTTGYLLTGWGTQIRGGSVVCSCSIDLSSTLAGKVLTRHVLTQTQAVTAGPVENLLPEGRQIGDAVILRGPMLSALGDLM